MKKLISVLLFCIISVSVYSLYEGYDYYVKDKVTGTNLEVVEFEDDLLIIDDLLNSDIPMKSTNYFSGSFAYGINSDTPEQTGNALFNGNMAFEGGSTVKYEVVDFELLESNVDQYGTTDAWGTGTLKYTATIKVTREIPVEVSYSFYQDVEDKNSFGQEIFIDGEDTHIELEDDGIQRFTHRRRCYAGCD